MTSRTRAAYGSWSSPLSAARITAGSLRLSLPRIDAGAVYWLEGRPAEGGRQVVMRAAPGGGSVCLTPDASSVRSRVHEYGGGDYTVRDGLWVASRDDDQRVVCGPAQPGAVLRELGDGSARYADFEVSPDGRFVVAVEERHRAGAPASNHLVALPLGGGDPLPLATDFDFVSFPRFSPAGDALAFTAWNQPDMPWDATELHVVAWGPEGPGARHRVAGGAGAEESIFQPGFSPAGVLTFVSDRSGWWNLEQWRDGARVPLCPRAAEFGRPQWAFALSTWDFVDEDTILCTPGEAGRYRLARLDLPSGRLEDLPLPFDVFGGVRVEGRRAALLAASPTRASVVGVLDLDSGRFEGLRESQEAPDPAWISVPETLTFPTGPGGAEVAHAFLYRPTSPEYEGLPGERPPLLVKGHGGPTGEATTALQPGVQYWTSRGFAVLDVNYRGSTGYGRAYRDRLRGGWGVLDVEDCVGAARFAAREGLADEARLAISGGSAGGYTVLCALAFHEVFGAGASHYGIGDLEALARDTHKFEARYLDRLVGPYPERRDLYIERSPLHAADRLSCPVIFFQGLEDKVVPPAQAEAMVAALAARGIPHAYVPFPGEGHGFRSAENQRTALEGELYFYAEIFGFPVDVAPPVEIRGLRR